MKPLLIVINILLLNAYSGVLAQDSVQLTSSLNTLSDDNHLVVHKDRTRSFINGNKHYPKLDTVRNKYIRWIDKHNREFPFAIPLLAYNKYDGMQIGAGFVNLKQPVKHIDFTASLFYGITSKRVSGTADINYYFRPKKGVVTEIRPGVNFKSFSYENYRQPLKYYAISPEINLTFKHRSEKYENLEYHLIFKNHVIFNKSLNYFMDGSTLKYNDTLTHFYANSLTFQFKRTDENFPFECSLNLEQTNYFVKTSFTANSFIRYQFKKMNTGVHIRFFAGGFLWRSNTFKFRLQPEVGYGLSGRTGKDDYLYGDFYIGRNEQEKFASRQISESDGFFKVMTPLNAIPVGETVNGMFAVNIKLDFPIQYVPLKLFFDMGYSVDRKLNPDNFLPVKGFQYDGGFMFSFFDEAFELYFPVLMSKDFKTYYKSNAPKFKQRISFLLDINKLQLHKKIRDLRL